MLCCAQDDLRGRVEPRKKHTVKRYRSAMHRCFAALSMTCGQTKPHKQKSEAEQVGEFYEDLASVVHEFVGALDIADVGVIEKRTIEVLQVAVVADVKRSSRM